MIVGVRQGGLSISETADHAQQSLEFGGNYEKNNNNQWAAILQGKPLLLMREVREEGHHTELKSDWKVTVMQITMNYIQWYAEEHLWTHNVSNL